MARYGCTITVAAGKIPSSQSNFSWVATEDNFPTAAIDGGAQSIAQSGGNLRCYVDSTKAIQLPIEVVKFVTSATTPSIVVWGLSPTLNVGGTVYIEADTVATSQPIESSTYGSEKVWVDYEYSSHDGVTDSTGNHTITQVGSPTTGTSPIGSDSVIISNTSQYGRTNGVPNLPYPYTLKALYKRGASTSSTAPFSYVDGSVSNQMAALLNRDAGSAGAYTRSGTGAFAADTSTTHVNGEWGWVTGVFIGTSSRKAYLNGGGEGVNTGADQKPTNLDRISYGRFDDASPANFFIGELAEMRVSGNEDTPNQITSEYNNQSAPATFWTTGTWEDQDASITIIESTGTLNLSTQNPTIEFTGTIAVEESTSTLNTTSQSPAITFTATLTIVESTQTISLTGFDPTIALTPPSTLVVVESTQSIDWTTQSPNITLSGTLTIEESTQTIDMLTRRPVIQLGIPTYTQIFTGIEKSYEFTGTIKSYGFTGIIATSQIFSGTEKAATFSGVKH